MAKITIFIYLLLGLQIAAHAAPQKAPTRANADNLTWSFAQHRKGQVQSIDYEMHFILHKGSEQFAVRTTLNTILKRVDQPLSIDLIWKKLESVKVNGTVVKDYVTRKGSLDIPAKYLTPTTQIEIAHVGEFNKEGHGVQRSVDPEDKTEYLFTDFEPYYAHTLFPCFNQPDLKATYTVSVDAPSDWKVISNDLVTQASVQGDRTHTTFAKTKLMSTYLFFLGAGPFAEWKDKAGDIPLVLYARQSLAKYVDANRIFDATKKGLKFFNEQFGQPFPFTKYGQVFIPEFAWGGMENPGAVTLNERYIFRGPATVEQIEGRNSLILHEMAHMWFGDLVTMEWWNDLWLNESFATYFAAIAQDRALHSTGTWQDFFESTAWGYWQDQLVTTHPIETHVADVRTAQGNFDGISYGKGGAVLKQLHFYVGEEGFLKGIRSYFQKYAFKNTTRADFINEIAAASQQDLNEWTRAWLQTAGPHRVQTQWSCKDGQIDAFTLTQKPNVSKSLSPHRTRIGLFKKNKQELELVSTKDVLYSQGTTPLPELLGKTCPDFVWSNLDDHDYALFSLDAKSVSFAPQVLAGAVSDPLLRLATWTTLTQMVRDTQLSITEFFEMALPGLEKESSESVLASLLGRHSVLRTYYYAYLTAEERAALAPRLENVIWKRVQDAKAGSNLQLTFFDFHTTIVQSPASLEKLNLFLKGDSLPPGLILDQDRRWALIKTLARNNFANVEALIAAEEKRDPSTQGIRTAYAARASVPTAAVKKKFWNLFQKPERIPYSTLRDASRSFHSPNHAELARPYIQAFFKNATSMDWQAHDNLTDIYFENLFPFTVCSSALLRESESKLKGARNLTPLARRAWLEANDELSKCVAIRKVARTSKSKEGRND